MGRKKDLTGVRFGKWTVVEPAEDMVSPSGNRFSRWKCVCDCGSTRVVTTNSLTSGKSQSCGCVQKILASNTARSNFMSHGMSDTRLYRIWSYMKKRCENPNASNYGLYGGRGVTVCDEWHDFRNFESWAISAGYDDEKSIDRIDVNGNYSPENCRWSDRVVQANNRRSNKIFAHNGEEHTLAEWSRILSIPYKNLHKKLSNGVPFENAIQK